MRAGVSFLESFIGQILLAQIADQPVQNSCEDLHLQVRRPASLLIHEDVFCKNLLSTQQKDSEAKFLSARMGRACW